MSSENTSSSVHTKEDQPSMVGGHAKYIQGAIASTLGYTSGEQTKKEAVQEMRDANETTDPNQQQAPMQSSILGTVEQKLGQVTGCEGMEKEGTQRLGAGSEETSGTG